MTGYEFLATMAIIVALVIGMLILPLQAFWVLYAVCAVLAGVVFAMVASRAVAQEIARRRVR